MEVSPYAEVATISGGRAPGVVYECVGKAGILSQMVDQITPGGRIVMGGYCLDPEEVYVPTAQEKRLRVHFAGGRDARRHGRGRGTPSPRERWTLRPWLGEGIGLSGVAEALARMSDPASPVRTVVDPTRE